MVAGKDDTTAVKLHGDEARLRSALKRVQQKLRGYAPASGNVSDELIADRRREAEAG